VNFQRGVARDEPEINLIPLIDVLLVILIFLMVTTTYARFSELQINLPQAQGDTAKDEPAQINILVDAGGVYRIDTSAIPGKTVEDIATALDAASAGDKESIIVISADATASHQSVIRVMDAARRVGLTRVTFVTQSAAAASP